MPSPGDHGDKPESQTGQPIGSGDGRIHIIPSLSSPSVKNGGKLNIQAVVKAKEGVKQVKAVIQRDGVHISRPIDTIILKPAPMNLDGPGADTTVGLWEAEWIAHDLEEGYYTIALTVMNGMGHVFTDHSLRFSDPIAGTSAPGSTDYPNGGMYRWSSKFFSGEDLLRCSVIDPSNGYAYFGTNTNPGKVVKVSLGAGDSAPTRVGAVTLASGESELSSAVIDPSAGYAYFGTWTVPGRVVKISLGAGNNPPTRVGAVTLDMDDKGMYSAVIDTSNGYAYFGTQSSPGRVVKVALGVGDDPPTRVGALDLNEGENDLSCAVIDPSAGYAWFGTYTNPARIVKVALGSGSNLPNRAGAVTLEPEEKYPLCAVIDPTAGYAYFSLYSSPGMVVKVSLGTGANPPARAGSISLSEGENQPGSAVIDPAAGYVYLGTHNNPGYVVKIDLSNFIRVGNLKINWGEGYLENAVIDPAAGYAYFGTHTSPGRVVKVALGVDDNLPVRIDATTLNRSREVISAVIDPTAGYAYYGTFNQELVKSDFGYNDVVGVLSLDFRPYVAVIDPLAGYAYFGTFGIGGVGRVVKVALGAGTNPPSYVGEDDFNFGENNPKCAVIDPTAGYAYFGTETSPGKVVKVALGSGDNPPSRVGALTLNEGEEDLICSVIDPDAGYAYFATNIWPVKVVKVALGSGNNLPIRIGAVTLNPGESDIKCGVIDTADGFAYFGANNRQLVKISLGTGNNPPSRVGTLTLNYGESAYCGVIDPLGDYAYFGNEGSITGRVTKIDLSNFTRVGALDLNPGEGFLSCAVIDSTMNSAWFGMASLPGGVVTIRLSQKNSMKATRFDMPEEGLVNSVHFYSHESTGKIRLGIYAENVDEKILLWQSPEMTNTATNDFLASPISSGTPTKLHLSAGTYWLAWQVDTRRSVASYTAGSSGNGFFIRRSFYQLPDTLNSSSITPTNEVWTQYITYTAGHPGTMEAIRDYLLGRIEQWPEMEKNLDGDINIADMIYLILNE